MGVYLLKLDGIEVVLWDVCVGALLWRNNARKQKQHTLDNIDHTHTDTNIEI